MSPINSDQPYAPPKTSTRTAQAPELTKTYVVLVIFFTFVSLGLYIPIWFLRRRKALNHLAPEDDNVNLVTFGLAALFTASLATGLCLGVLEELGTTPSPGLLLSIQGLDLLARLFIIVASFRVKTILEGHFPERLSAVGTFFLSIFYLQYRINRAGETDPVAEQFSLR